MCFHDSKFVNCSAGISSKQASKQKSNRSSQVNASITTSNMSIINHDWHLGIQNVVLFIKNLNYKI